MEQTSGLCPQSLTGMLSRGQGCMLGTVVPCSLYVLKSQVSPTDVPRDVRCTGCSIQQPAGEGAPHSPPLLSWGFSESKMYPVPQEPFLVHRQGVCMRAHAAGVGAVSVCPLPQLCSCPVTVRAAFSHGHSSTPSPKVLVQPATHFVRFLCRINICICSEPLLGTFFSHLQCRGYKINHVGTEGEGAQRWRIPNFPAIRRPSAASGWTVGNIWAFLRPPQNPTLT